MNTATGGDAAAIGYAATASASPRLWAKLAIIRCPYDGVVAAEIWSNGQTRATVTAEWDASLPDGLREALTVPFSEHGGYPWCEDPGHALQLSGRDRARIIQRQTEWANGVRQSWLRIRGRHADSAIRKLHSVM